MRPTSTSLSNLLTLHDYLKCFFRQNYLRERCRSTVYDISNYLTNYISYSKEDKSDTALMLLN